jgi:hypothetical protein
LPTLFFGSLATFSFSSTFFGSVTNIF